MVYTLRGSAAFICSTKRSTRVRCPLHCTGRDSVSTCPVMLLVDCCKALFHTTPSRINLDRGFWLGCFCFCLEAPSMIAQEGIDPFFSFIVRHCQAVSSPEFCSAPGPLPFDMQCTVASLCLSLDPYPAQCFQHCCFRSPLEVRALAPHSLSLLAASPLLQSALQT